MSDDKLHDECGVVGVFLNNAKADSAATLAYYGLYSLQHRGQESAGIAVSNDEVIKIQKAMGLVSDVFVPQHLAELKGHIAVGHVRYATAGGRTIENAQPMLNKFKLGSIALAHNGQLVNYEPLQEMLEETGSTFTSTSDTEIILKLIARNYKKGLEQAVTNAIQVIKGSFALCVMTENCLIGARDPYGIRPLCLGQLEDGWVLASESCAIDAMNGTFVRDVNPGEVIIISADGLKSVNLNEKTSKQTCIFEYVYFARPDSIIDGIPVQYARLKMGEMLAKENPVEADVVVGVPDSGIGAALGYSAVSGVPYATGIVKNKYIGRTFIAPTQKERENMVFVKLNAIKSDLNGKRVIVIDDSIVRGTTSRRLVQILRRAGAKEVHFRVSSPPVKYPCYLGIDTPTKAELISSAHDVEQIRKEIGADSLSFISLEGMLEALRSCRPESNGYCKGCFCGEYPIAQV
ncbi:MAG: amidophosphoribosyltransferase [Treponema porcinum]|uniref:amidophosphoribosyltransferase n=1 Tax=Treponema porcinum TaxID=261392 RepID=UPI002354BD75|nr:amidophosphoribosyltransferase [Treponema porcinum]MCI6179063.1 amidophosphoribosyltransferase [Treponema porcinum]MCI7534354.1 amidophosphoribosyltransferase [Treponema porcinum]MCI7546751.1 amidophosphoribosyltransferase [Treponema porcinum]